MFDNIGLITLVEQARGGNGSACGELVARFWSAVHAGVCKRLGDPVEAEDITQEAFIHGLRKLNQLRDPRCFGSWLRQAADRFALNRLARRRVYCSLDDVGTALHTPAPEPIDELLRAERCTAIRRALDRLRPADRNLLLTRYCDGRSLTEMAHQLGISAQTVKSRLHTARGRLRAQLTPLALAG